MMLMRRMEDGGVFVLPSGLTDCSFAYEKRYLLLSHPVHVDATATGAQMVSQSLATVCACEHLLSLARKP